MDGYKKNFVYYFLHVYHIANKYSRSLRKRKDAS